MPRLVLVLLAVVLALGCATPERRIAKNQEAFDAYPAEVQEKIRRGEIAVGFTQEQVVMALGEPNRKTEVFSDDQVAHVWTWTKTQPGIGIGFGTGQRVGNVGIGTGISTGRGSTTEDERVVEFVNGVVRRYEVMVER